MVYSPCFLCHAAAARGEDFCQPCLADMPWNHRACLCCALPIADPFSSHCTACSQAPPPFEFAVANFRYAYPIDHLLLRYKQHGDEVLGAKLARLMLNSLSEDTLFQLSEATLIPVAMHPQDLRKRGFNQAQQLADSIAAQISLPVDNRLLATRTHSAQKSLNAAQRHQNLRGVFHFPGQAPKHCVIVDDVITTGATVSAVTQQLKQRGSEQISVLCLARTPAPGH